MKSYLIKESLKKYKRRVVLAVLGWFLSVKGVSAAPGGTLSNPLEADTLTAFVADLIGAIKYILTPIIVLLIIYAGFQFVMARGDADKLETAKKSLLYVVIGAAIILGAEVLQEVIVGTVDNIDADV